MTQKTALLFCRCGADIISTEKAEQLAEAFSQISIDVFELRDLCALSVHDKKVLQTIGTTYPFKVIVACYPRAVKNLFIQTGIEMDKFDVLNFKELSTEQILDKLTNHYQLQPGKAQYSTLKSELNVPAWFPVIEQARCTLCGKCARFCLFGVYRFDKKSLVVENPLSCKNNCPACGRTCPASAIMFPRLPEKTTLAGAEPGELKTGYAAENESLLTMLNERNRTRPAIFKLDVIQQAENERMKALEELKKNTKKEN